MATKKLFTPIMLGGKNNPITLSHRVAMAPLTRLKADADGVQPDMAITYYSQRASKGGLIIAEATHISETARGYFGAPGIYSDKQVASWKKITDGVHAKDGKIFLQIWHTGRLSHPLNQPNGQLPVSSSANMDITTGQMVPTPEGFKPHVAPRALKTEEIPQISKDFKTATQNALEAGFDGVEFHCANGYLPEQFLQDGINDRTDRYGGSIENRARFLFETLESILDVIDSSRVGIRLAPYSMSFGQCESKPLDTYGYVMKKLNDYDLAYAHLIEPRAFPLHESPNAPNHGIARDFRPMYDGVLMTASGYNRETAIKVVEDGDADMVAIGRAFISNPDLPRRFELDAPINAYNPDTFYTPGPAGYIDQPSLEEQQ